MLTYRVGGGQLQLMKLLLLTQCNQETRTRILLHRVLYRSSDWASFCKRSQITRVVHLWWQCHVYEFIGIGGSGI